MASKDEDMYTTLGYELESKQVRQYRINDASTVRRAIMTNIEEYLVADGGVICDVRSETLRYAIGATSVVVGASVYLAGLWPFRVPFLIMKPYLVASVVFYVACSALMYYLIRYVDADCFFVSYQAKRQPTSAAAEKESVLGGLLSGKRIRLRAKTKDAFTPVLQLQAELVDSTASWFRPAKVLATVEKSFTFGDFFDVDGFVYPPNLKQATHRLLVELMAKKSS